MTSTATTAQHFVACHLNDLNTPIYRVTPLADGMQLVEFIGREHADRELADYLLARARGIAQVTGSTEATHVESRGAHDVSLRWVRKGYNTHLSMTIGVHRAPVEANPAQAELAARATAQTRTTPAKGDRWVVSTTTGYQLAQNRPYEHQTCRCGQGTTTYTEGTVTGLTHWADNSVDVHVALDGGGTRTVQVTAPHGDACF